jgi:hypothetical protein
MAGAMQPFLAVYLLSAIQIKMNCQGFVGRSTMGYKNQTKIGDCRYQKQGK